MRRLRKYGALIVCIGVLTACSGDDPADDAAEDPAATDTETSAPETTEAEATDTSEAPADTELTGGLLPAEEFGEGFTATSVGAAELASIDPSTALAGLTISPPECAGLLDAVSPFTYTDTEDFAAQSVASGAATSNSYAQVLAGGVEDLDLDDLRAQVQACPTLTLSREGLTAEISYVPLDGPEVGDAALVLRSEATVQAEGQSQTLVGSSALVLDGDRLLALVAIGSTPAEDGDDAFADLLTRAFDFQSDALG